MEAIQRRNGLGYDELPSDNEVQTGDDADIKAYFQTTQPTVEMEYQEDAIEQKEVVASLLDTLGDRERYIITKYHGIDGGESMTLEEIGDELGITKERVRQLYEKTRKLLRDTIMTNSAFSAIYK